MHLLTEYLYQPCEEGALIVATLLKVKPREETEA